MAVRIDTLGIEENACPVIIEYNVAIQRKCHHPRLFYQSIGFLDTEEEFTFSRSRRLGKMFRARLMVSSHLCVQATISHVLSLTATRFSNEPEH